MDPDATPTQETRKPSLLVIGYDRVGEKMAGPGIRSWELAHAVAARGVQVTFASETPVGRDSQALRVVKFSNSRQLCDLANSHNAVLLQGLTLNSYPELEETSAVRIVDLYDPWVLENLELHAAKDHKDAEQLLLADAHVQKHLLEVGDMFVCASDRQRDYWLGMLTGQGRLVPSVHADDPDLRSLIDVVPYGCPSTPPAADPVGGLRGTLGISADAPVVLWSGGAWEWFDPLLVLDAVEIARTQVPDLQLVFLGLVLSGQPEMPVAAAIAQRIRESAVLTDAVKVGDWIPYDQRGAWLKDADVSAVITRPGIESRLAFRSRVLDHLWAGLPTVTTPGDVLGELVTQHGAGWTIPFGDVDALAALFIRIGKDRAVSAEAGEAASLLAERFAWSTCATALIEPAENPERWLALREVRTKDPFGDMRGLRSDRILLGLVRRPAGFHSRGFFADAFKLSPLYPLLRRARRSKMGTRLLGRVA